MSTDAARADRRTRVEFLSALSGWLGAGGGRFLVWFDGDDPADMTPPPGIMVRYSAPESADAAICRRLREIGRPGEVIVVTNDRELASRCMKAGTNVLDWNQFTLKMRARSTAPPRAARPAAESRRRANRADKTRRTPVDASANVDVGEWLRYFGIDETD
jgi:hypothetical protein